MKSSGLFYDPETRRFRYVSSNGTTGQPVNSTEKPKAEPTVADRDPEPMTAVDPEIPTRSGSGTHSAHPGNDHRDSKRKESSKSRKRHQRQYLFWATFAVFMMVWVFLVTSEFLRPDGQGRIKDLEQDFHGLDNIKDLVPSPVSR